MSNALRPFALGAALVACCLLTWPASAQFHNTRLSDKGRALEKTTRARVEACRVVYQWDRCHGRRNIMDDIADLHSNRRQRCIMSSRNVAAEKGATHYTVEGHVFTGYRCTVYKAVSPAPEDRDEEREEVQRYSMLGFVPWGGACVGIEELYGDVCESQTTSYGLETCREARLQALEAGERIYYQEKVDRQISYDAKEKVFTVALRGVLGRLGAPSDQRYLTTGPLVVPRGRTTTEGLADAARPFGRFEVPAADLPSPQTFERDVQIEALVQPVRIHAPTRRNPAKISTLEVRVIGVRAFVPDLSWGAVIVRPPDSVPHYRCQPLDPQTPE